MTGIAKVSEKMKKKISFGDYSVSSDKAAVPSQPEPEQKPNAAPEAARKIYSLSKEDTEMLQKIFSKRLNSPNQSSISQIMSEAIHLLYKQELFS